MLWPFQDILVLLLFWSLEYNSDFNHLYSFLEFFPTYPKWPYKELNVYLFSEKNPAYSVLPIICTVRLI